MPLCTNTLHLECILCQWQLNGCSVILTPSKTCFLSRQSWSNVLFQWHKCFSCRGLIHLAGSEVPHTRVGEMHLDKKSWSDVGKNGPPWNLVVQSQANSFPLPLLLPNIPSNYLVSSELIGKWPCVWTKTLSILHASVLSNPQSLGPVF